MVIGLEQRRRKRLGKFYIIKGEKEGYVKKRRGICRVKDSIIDFKEKLEEDESFREKIAGASNLDEVVDIAKECGCKIELDEILEDVELSDELLEAAAGGESNTYINSLIGDYNFEFTADIKEDASKIAQMMVDELHKRGIYGKG